MLFASSQSALASVGPATNAQTPLILASAKNGAISEFAKEQTMSLAERMVRWTPFIKEASRRFGIAEDWIKAVMRLESGGRTQLSDKRPIISKAGAMGIMQMMPASYRDMRQLHGLGADPYDPRDNVLAGAAYLRWLQDKYGYPKMFAAYNAGPGTLDEGAAGSRKLPAETRAYVKGIAYILGDKADIASPEPAAPRPKIATLTRPDGSPVRIDGASVNSIRASLAGEYAPGVRTVVALGEKRQGVREDLATVASLLKRQDAVFVPHAVAG